ncbi:hypothetical protein DBS1_290020 [Escherichia coli]|nr:hypothetical protein DBS1_290020 [Escherichia coli]
MVSFHHLLRQQLLQKIVFFGELSFFRERDLSWYQGSLPVKQIFIVQVLLKKELKNLMS